jgi:deoxyribose-phosphate aldolase
MTRIELASRIDLTLLKPDTVERDIVALVTDGLRYPFATVCVPPCHVGLAVRLIGQGPIKVSTVTGFPLGYSTTRSKVFESAEACEAGASEIDTVMNISLFKSGKFNAVESELRSIVAAAAGAAVKVIIEACYLTDDEKRLALNIAINAGARFVKTSTGWGKGGATVEDIRLLHDEARGRIDIKASGGIKTTEDALRMIEAGAERVGASSGIAIVEGLDG